MKFSLIAVLAAAASSTTHAFTVDAKSSRITTKLSSTTLEEQKTTTTSAPPLTRFERLKQLYKGPPAAITSDESVEFSYEEFAQAVKETKYEFRRNSIVSGICVEFVDGGALVDIGAKASAFLPFQEAALINERETKDISNLIDLDKEYDFQIISDEDENGQLLVSIRRIQYRQAWDKVTELSKTDEIVDNAPVIAVNRGGAICSVHGLRAFLPGSHLTGLLPTEDLIGQYLPLKFLEVDIDNNKLVVSHRKAVVEQQMEHLSRGDLVKGVVKAIKPYGAFVEIDSGSMSGLLHISQISYDRIANLEQVLQIGMEIKCMIIDHDKVNGRIALSTKTLEPQPGEMLKNPNLVFEQAEETAKKYHERMEAERQAREEAARDIVLGLGDSLDDLTDDDDEDNDKVAVIKDPLADVSDSLDSLLSSS